MITRRQFMKRSAQTGFVAATSPLWCGQASRAFAQMPVNNYKAIVVVSMEGGNDSNNMVIPLDSYAYSEYARIRGDLAIAPERCIPLRHGTGEASYGLHPALQFTAQLYNAQQALIAANVGPISRIVTKSQYLANPSVAAGLFSHSTAVPQWESALTTDTPATGWGGRMGDHIADQSGKLPPVLSTGLRSMFTVGNTVQAVSVQTGSTFAVLPPDLDSTILRIATQNSTSSNPLVAQAAMLRASALQQQVLIDQAEAYRPLKTQFYRISGFASCLERVAKLIAGRSVTGASKQIFFVPQGGYDSHTNQLGLQFGCLDELDNGLRSFFSALDELGMTNQVLVCTLSDFNRTYAPNTNAGSDHGWGTHQIVMGGGIQGGRMLGTMPTLELGGPDDMNGLGCWVPTTSVTQLVAGVGAWMGLSSPQMGEVLPELGNFASGALRFA